MSQKQSEIILKVTLDEDKIPEKIEWKADGNPNASGYQPVKALLLSLFDAQAYDTLRIDLWTKEMQVNEMDMFIYQTLQSMAQTYNRATGNQDIAGQIQSFANQFAEDTKLYSQE